MKWLCPGRTERNHPFINFQTSGKNKTRTRDTNINKAYYTRDTGIKAGLSTCKPHKTVVDYTHIIDTSIIFGS